MPVEIERKFLVTDDSYKQSAYACDHILQGYVCRQGGNSTRVRVRGGKGWLTIKGPSLDGGLSRYEWEREIPVEEARELIKLCHGGIIDKYRYLVRWGTHIFEVDEFHGDNEGLIIAEVELSSTTEHFERPPFLGREVTGEAKYYNGHLSRNPYKLWEK